MTIHHNHNNITIKQQSLLQTMFVCPNTACPRRNGRRFNTERGLHQHLRMSQPCMTIFQSSILPTTSNKRPKIIHYSPYTTQPTSQQQQQQQNHPTSNIQHYPYSMHDIHNNNNYDDDDVDNHDDDNGNNNNKTNDDDDDNNDDNNNQQHDGDDVSTTIALTTEQQHMCKLIKLLDDINAPDYALQSIMQWAHDAHQSNFKFQPKCNTRHANIQWMHKLLHNTHDFLPILHPVPMMPNNNNNNNNGTSIDCICFDFVPQLLSMLQDTELMQPHNLVIDHNNPCAMYKPHDNYLGECHTGSVYCNMYAQLINDPTKQLLCPIIAYIDKTHVDVNGRFTLEPFMFTTSLFTSQTRCTQAAWRLFGYVQDISSSSSVQSALPPLLHSAWCCITDSLIPSCTHMQHVRID